MIFEEPFDLRVTSSGAPGPTLCIVGGVHGDEPAGVAVVERLRTLYPHAGSLQRGRLLTLVANSRAVRERRRAIDLDLNRAFGVSTRECHEAVLSGLLESTLAGADYVLDLHSTSAPSPVFAAGARSSAHLAFCAAVGVESFSYGWSGPRSHSMLVDAVDRLGGVGLLVECGRHGTEETVRAAMDAATQAMRWLGLIDGADPGKAASRYPRVVRVEEIVKASSDDIALRKPFESFEPVPKGTPVFTDGSRDWIAPADFLILIPARGRVRRGDDLFAIGVPEIP